MRFFITKLEKDLAKYSGVDCEIESCNRPLSVNVKQYSEKTYGKQLCYNHQKMAQRFDTNAEFEAATRDDMSLSDVVRMEQEV